MAALVEPVIGLIGGSGLYDIDGLEERAWQEVATPWGAPSDALLTGRLSGVRCVFLPRHGRGHPKPPSELNYRANIAALKLLGVTEILSLSAVGSLREELAPGHFVIVDQFIDRTFAREKSFFGSGCVAHVSMAHPVAPRLQDRIAQAAQAEDIACVRGGTYVCMEGPQFSSLAESLAYQAMGCDVIGMTAMPEAKLAREAEISYATVAMVTDFDCWHPDHDEVDVAAVIKVVHENAAKAGKLLARLISDFPKEHEACPVGSDRALENAIMTAPAMRDPDLLKKLDAILARVNAR